VDHFYGSTGCRTTGLRVMARMTVEFFSKGELLRLSIDRVIDSLPQMLFRKTVSLAEIVCFKGILGGHFLDISQKV